MLTDELLNVTNKRLAEIDEIILMNANNILKLIDLQKSVLNDAEEHTEDNQVLRQIDEQIQHLTDSRVLFVLLGKFIVKNELTEQEKRVFLKLFKRN